MPVTKGKTKAKKKLHKLRSAIRPTKKHSDKTKYSRKGKWAKRKGLE